MKKLKQKAAGGHQAAFDIQDLRLKNITQEEIGQLPLSIGFCKPIPILRCIWEEFLENNLIGGGIYE